MAAIWSFIVAVVVAAVVLMIVSRLNLGLSVANFTSAIIAAIALWVLVGLGVICAMIFWALTFFGWPNYLVTQTAHLTLYAFGGSTLISGILWLISQRWPDWWRE